MFDDGVGAPRIRMRLGIFRAGAIHRACSPLKNQAIGVSRGGKNTKIHVLINERMQLLSVSLSGGHIHDSEPALDLFAGIELNG